MRKYTALIITLLCICSSFAQVVYKPVLIAKFADLKIHVMTWKYKDIADEIWLCVDSPKNADIIITKKGVKGKKSGKLGFVDYNEGDKNIVIDKHTTTYNKKVYIEDEHLKVKLLAR